MVALKGTEKQVAWAEKIRAERIAYLKKMTAPATEKDAKALAFVLDVLENDFDRAGDWIDHRYSPVNALINWTRESPRFLDFVKANA